MQDIVLNSLASLQSGKYAVDLLVGDASITTPVAWRVANLAVTFQPLEDGSQPPSPGPTLAQQAYLPKPEIQHRFREPAPRPPVVVSVVAAGLALAPLGLLVYLLSAVGGNLKVIKYGSKGCGPRPPNIRRQGNRLHLCHLMNEHIWAKGSQGLYILPACQALQGTAC